MNLLRGAVSKKKLRYQDDGFDLDLSYVYDKRLIAMGFPSEGAEGMYRNNMVDVKRFFKLKHDGHYKVYNLCSERSYSANHFKNATASFPFDDHCPCPFHLLIGFCEDAHEFLKQDERNIIAVHCKAGKGRTGLVLCCFMLFEGYFKAAKASLEHYAEKRTLNGKGVTIASQIRWVYYFEHYMANYRNVSPPKVFPPLGIPLQVCQVIIHGIPKTDSGTCIPYIKIQAMKNNQLIFDSKLSNANLKTWKKDKKLKEQIFTIDTSNCIIHADVQFTLYNSARMRDQRVCGVWVNSTFMNDQPMGENGIRTYKIPKKSIDGYEKDKGEEEFAITITYTTAAADVVQEEPTEEEDTKDDRQNKKGNAGLIRKLVSKKKLRYVKDGFDLDLSYISESGNAVPPIMVAMGFPSVSLEGMYRNQMSDVQKFLKYYHNGHYKVYNLCSERTYTPNYFENSTASYPFDDHNPCPFHLLVKFCEDAAEYLGRDPLNAIIVHCKAGKGRTGLVLSAALLRMKICETSEKALAYYGKARTSNVKGVTIPSQQRYVSYYEEYLSRYHQTGIEFPALGPKITLKGFFMSVCPTFSGGGCTPYFKVTLIDKTLIYNSKPGNKALPKWKKKVGNTYTIVCEVPVQGDVHIVWYSEDSMGKDSKMFGFWFNTTFITEKAIKLQKLELDSAAKDKHCSHFDKDFSCTVYFSDLPKPPKASPLEGLESELKSPRRKITHIAASESSLEQVAAKTDTVAVVCAGWAIIDDEEEDEAHVFGDTSEDEDDEDDDDDEDVPQTDNGEEENSIASIGGDVAPSIEAEPSSPPASKLMRPVAGSIGGEDPLWELLETRLAEQGRSMSDIDAAAAMGRGALADQLHKLNFNVLQCSSLIRVITRKQKEQEAMNRTK